MKILAIFTIALAAQGAMASEVGATNPKGAEQTGKTVELALADKGAGASWSVEPLTFQATAHQTAELNTAVEKMNAKVSTDLDARIAEKLAQSLSN